MTKQDKVILNPEQLLKIAKQQGVILEDLQIIQNSIFFIPETGHYEIDEQLNLIHNKIQRIVEVLDRTTFTLYNNDDEEELKSLGVEISEELEASGFKTE